MAQPQPEPHPQPEPCVDDLGFDTRLVGVDPVPRAPGALVLEDMAPRRQRVRRALTHPDLAALAHRNRHRLVEFARKYPAVPVRRAITEGRAGWATHLPAGVRRRLDLDGSVVTPLRVEIGGGAFPTPGYVHVDADRLSRHLEYVAKGWRMPFPDASVQELLAVHVLEHIHPGSIHRTLKEWCRILAPGGFAEIHVPDASTILPAYVAAPNDKKWELLVPIFGTTTDPLAPRRGPGSAGRPPRQALLDHHNVIYDFDLLRFVLLRAGFDRVENVSDTVTDRHNQTWQASELVSRISLAVRAYAVPAAPAASPGSAS
ncbi:MAG: class I SAM-dependent methyltransferase [Acidimicrobiales bacterium]